MAQKPRPTGTEPRGRGNVGRDSATAGESPQGGETRRPARQGPPKKLVMSKLAMFEQN